MPSDDAAIGPADRLASALRALHARGGAPSTRNLAQRIGTVSHTTVAEVLAGKRLSSWSTVREIVRTLGGDEDEFERLWLSASAAAHPAERPDTDFVAQYRRQVTAFNSYLKPTAPGQRILVPFTQLYIHQKVTDLTTGEASDIWAFDDKLQRAVVLGDPGSGKSTCCRAIMLRHAAEIDRPVPFLVTLRNFASAVPPARSVVGYIEQTLETVFQLPVPEGAVARLLARGHALVMFDGLDELTSAAARDVASIIELFSQQFPQARVLVTSRITGYSHAGLDPHLFRSYRLLRFTQEDAASYIRRRLAAMPPFDQTDERQERASRQLLELISQFPELQSNPLLLGFAVQLSARSSSVPSDLSTLVGSSIDLLLNEWDRSRGIGIAEGFSLPLESALQDLAFHMLDIASPGLPEDELIELLTESLQDMVATKADAKAAARSVLSYARERAWILGEVGLDRAGRGIYQFSHRTFQEYLAAQRLIAAADPMHDLTERLSNPNWRMAAEFALELLNLRGRGSGTAELVPREHSFRMRREQRVQQLLQAGWEVTEEPDRGALPEPLHGFQPDILARRGSELLVVEVKSRRSRDLSRLSALASAVARVPDAKLEVNWLSDAAEFAPPAEHIRAYLNEASRLLSAGAVTAAVLIAWAALEGAVFYFASDKDDVQRWTTPWQLLSRLHGRGYVCDRDFERLTTSWKLRNEIAHHVSPLTPIQEDIEFILTTAERMISGRYVSPQQMIE